MVRKNSHAPLTPAVFHILLALSQGERHGYDIMRQVKLDTNGAIRMGPGTLYGSIDRMIDAGLVVRSDTTDARRIYYRLTPRGKVALSAEAQRLLRTAELVRNQLRPAQMK
jgi:DNA-binding PadR family transcriptional regulator